MSKTKNNFYFGSKYHTTSIPPTEFSVGEICFSECQKYLSSIKLYKSSFWECYRTCVLKKRLESIPNNDKK